ncbi:MAG: Na+/H+ antiporter NhaA [Chitinophagales bacterium]|nr:Na+/H+ antiporter NhaA [Chitinophagales bacterium]
MNVTKLFKSFFENEKSGGILLILCTILSLTIANGSWGPAYHEFWTGPKLGNSLEYWINDGLMALFFLLVGLELKRELMVGELANIKEAMLPLMGALGGVIIPAGIYFMFNYGTPEHSGAGIPMATDIAFALGVLSLLGNKVPIALRVFLTALAVIDDLGAIIVIGLFYSSDLSWMNLGIALGIFGVLLILNKNKVNNLIPYLLGGVAMWYFMLHSGVHATISGVLLALTIPLNNGSEKSPSHILESILHRPVPFIILPLFALANTAIIIEGEVSEIFQHNYGIGIALGLVIGKPVGIFLFSYLSSLLGWSKLPSSINWKNLFAVGILGGIGYTMSIFVALLAFDDHHVIDNSKLAILISSSVAAILGLIWLNISLNGSKKAAELAK